MINIVICDDDRSLNNELTLEIKKIMIQNKNVYKCNNFYDGEELIKYLKLGSKIEILLLDIEMEKINGLEVGNYIRNKLDCEKVKIIYMSSNKAYALNLFKFRPHDFIVKPIDKELLKETFNKAIKLIEIDAYFTYKNEDSFVKVNINDITYFTIKGKKVEINFINGNKDIFIGKIKDVSNELSKYEFIFTHRSYLVHYRNINKINKSYCYFNDEVKVPISRNYSEEIKEYISNKVLGGI